MAVTSDDATNLLVSLLAKQLGIPKVITRVGRTRNRRLFERVGIDAPLTPRTAAVQEVLNWLKIDEVDHLATIEDRAEVMEVTFPYDAAAGRGPHAGVAAEQPVGAILRKQKVHVPRGDTVIQPGDHLFLITTPGQHRRGRGLAATPRARRRGLRPAVPPTGTRGRFAPFVLGTGLLALGAPRPRCSRSAPPLAGEDASRFRGDGRHRPRARPAAATVGRAGLEPTRREALLAVLALWLLAPLSARSRTSCRPR